jgi:hypothetical protein
LRYRLPVVEAVAAVAVVVVALLLLLLRLVARPQRVRVGPVVARLPRLSSKKSGKRSLFNVQLSFVILWKEASSPFPKMTNDN